MQVMEFIEISNKIKESIRKKVAESGVTMRQISLKAGKNPGLISEILRDNAKSKDVKTITILKIAEALNCSPQELTGNSGGKVKVTALITASTEFIYLAESDELSIELSAMIDPDKYEARVIRGSWNIKVEDGWAVVYSKKHGAMRQECVDALCIGKITGGKEFLAKLRPGTTPNRYHLIGSNEDPILDIEVEWCERIEFIVPSKVALSDQSK